MTDLEPHVPDDDPHHYPQIFNENVQSALERLENVIGEQCGVKINGCIILLNTERANCGHTSSMILHSLAQEDLTPKELLRLQAELAGWAQGMIEEEL